MKGVAMNCPKCPIRNVIWLRACVDKNCPLIAIQPNLDGTQYDGRRGPLWCAAVSALVLGWVALSMVLS